MEGTYLNRFGAGKIIITQLVNQKASPLHIASHIFIRYLLKNSRERDVMFTEGIIIGEDI